MRLFVWAAAPLAILTLAACGGGDSKTETADGEPAVSTRTLAALVKGDRAFAALAGVVDNAGLSAVLESRGPYTVFAPSSAAFEAAGEDFTTAPMKAPAAALLRSHIVPGAITRGDVEAAIAADADGKVEMRTMGDGILTFSRDGDLLKVTAADGAVAGLTGQETVASNGVLQPIDALLVK